jgi:uncharacterized protein (DUF2252 family)
MQTTAARRAAGREARRGAPRSGQSAWRAPDGRADPVDVLIAQADGRVDELLPIRYGRMAASPFAFLRGAAAVMSHDLAHGPTTGLTVQACGDAHLANFGVFASPERRLLFDLNDFDETHPGPWEWDLKRLAASILVAARVNGSAEPQAAEAAMAAGRAYRETMRELAQMRTLEVWYSRQEAEETLAALTGERRLRVERGLAKARRRTADAVLPRLSEVVDGHRRIRDDPPLLVRVTDERVRETLFGLFTGYRRSLPHDLRTLIDRFTPVDVALKVVGVGSVGTRCGIFLLEAGEGDDPLVIQGKQACPSVLQPFTARSAFRNHGQRVVVGQRLLQASSDILLGWTRAPDGLDYYFRQLRDMKFSARIETMSAADLALYSEVCGRALARAHARGGDRVAIAAYLGRGDAFERALTGFAVRYADQTERDHAALLDAARRGRVTIRTDV